MEKILMISYQFPPDSGSIQRIINYVKYLPENNWLPIVLTHKSTSLLSEEIDEQLLQKGIIVHRCGSKFSIRNLFAKKSNASISNSAALTFTPAPKKGLFFSIKQVVKAFQNFVYWPDKRVIWIPFAFFKAMKIIKAEKINTVYIVTPPHSASLIGYFLKKFSKIKLIIDYRDPWANDFDLNAPTLLHRLAHKKAEKAVINKADAIITTTDAHTKYFVESVVKKEKPKVYTITNGVDIQSYKPKYGELDKNFTIVYTGNFDSSRQPDALLQAVSNIKMHSPHVFVPHSINFYGWHNIFLDEKVKQFGISELIKQNGLIKFNEVIEEMAKASVLLLVVHNDPSTPKFSIPAKLFEYIASGRPILAITPKGAASDIIVKYNLGKCFEHSDIAGIENAILSYYNDFKDNKLETKVPDNSILNLFDRRHLTMKLAKVMNNL